MDAQSLAQRVRSEAKSAIDSQIAHLRKSIAKLRSQVAQFHADFVSYQVDQYAPGKAAAVKKYSREALWQPELGTYTGYKQAEFSLRECLKLCYAAIAKSIEASNKSEYARLKIAFAFLLLSLLLGILSFVFWAQGSMSLPLWFATPIPLVISNSIWDWGSDKPPTEFSWGFLVTMLLGPFMGIVSLFFIFGYSGGSEAIDRRYKQQLMELKQKYTPQG